MAGAIFHYRRFFVVKPVSVGCLVGVPIASILDIRTRLGDWYSLRGTVQTNSKTSSNTDECTVQVETRNGFAVGRGGGEPARPKPRPKHPLN